MPWSTSDRRDSLPRDWHKRRAIAKRNAGGQCQWVDNGARCTQPGTDADHAGHRLDHDNLQWLCRDHHKIKTAAESAAARAAVSARGKHPTETHPGLR